MQVDELTAIREAFPAPPDPDAEMLARAQARLDTVIHAGTQRRSRRRTIVLAAAALALVGAGLAAGAATTGLFDRDVTRADLDARAETVTRTVIECWTTNGCDPPRVETVREIVGEEADGVVFIDPEGFYVQVVPAENSIGSESGSIVFRAARPTLELNVRSHIEFALPDGGTRTIAWTRGEGTVDVTDRLADGSTSQTTLHSGDVVPLLPGTLDDQPQTPDKSVMVDLDFGHGEGYPLWIYPQLNRAFAGQEPWRSPRTTPLVLPTRTVAHYGLVSDTPGHYTLPTTPAGGTWTYELRAGGTRTIAWVAGESSVTVTDRNSAGDEMGTEVVPIGRQLSGG